jgi:hypothetical protein
MPVFAGHNLAGGFCECGAPGCICDPGEEIHRLSNASAPDDESTQNAPADFDLGSETLLLLAVLLLALRYKA